MFRVGDKIVHPMHGAGVVDEIVTRKVDGVLREMCIRDSVWIFLK